MKKQVLISIFVTMLLVLFLTACSSNNDVEADNNDGTSHSSGPYTVTDFNDRNVSFKQVPQRVAALSISETNIVYALGGALVGRPASDVTFQFVEAQDVTEVGTTHGLNLEKMASVKPDLVFAHNVMNEKDLPGLEGLGAKVILTSGNSIEDIKKQITVIGDVLQRQDKASELVAEIEQKVEELSSGKKKDTPVLIVYGAPGTYMAALPSSLSGDILRVAGGKNIAENYPSISSYPQYATLDMELIAESNPAVILIMTHAQPEQVRDSFIKEMESSSAWSNIDAVKNQRIEVLPGDLFGSNPGTKIIESIEYMHQVLHK